MKFIRDIIAERSDVKPSEPMEMPAASETEAAPASAPKSESRRPDRTMTRLSDGTMLGADDVFKRLLGENADAAMDAMKSEDAPAVADPSEDEDEVQAEFDEDSNLFDDLAKGFFEPEEEDHSDEGIPELIEPVTDAISEEQSVAIADAAPTSEDESAPIAEVAPEIEPVFDVEPAKPARETSVPPVDFSATPQDEPEQPIPAIETPSVPDMVAVPAPASGRSGRGAGRVKTRLLGFGMPETPVRDPFSAGGKAPGPAPAQSTFPVGWLVVTAGPGRGTSFALHDGVSQIGRGEDQAIRLDFGDTSISRSNHAAIAYDSEQGGFYLGHGGKANMVRLNDRPVLSTEEISSGAMIRIGETTMRFIALCDGNFSWAEEGL